MDEETEFLKQRYHLYASLKDSAYQAATMCALYTHAGLYDLAKERAGEWSNFELDAKQELNRLMSETKARSDQSWARIAGAQGTGQRP